jgi:hypothetical protein
MKCMSQSENHRPFTCTSPYWVEGRVKCGRAGAMASAEQEHLTHRHRGIDLWAEKFTQGSERVDMVGKYFDRREKRDRQQGTGDTP